MMMPVTFVIGGLLVLTGLYGYFSVGADDRSATALIPTVVGLLLMVCGLIALKPPARRHAMHAAAAVALLGFLAAFGRGMTSWFNDQPWNLAKSMILTMAILTAVYLAFSIRSFIAARRARTRLE